MARYRLVIAYDGTDFCGWQKQEPPLPHVATSGGLTRAMEVGQAAGLAAGQEGRAALRTVQAVVEKALREVVREPVLVLGASRTDAGVHARGQVAVFDSPTEARPTEPRPSRSGERAAPLGASESSRPRTPGDVGSESRPTRGNAGFQPALTHGPSGRLEAGVPRGIGWPIGRGLDTLKRAANARLPDDVLIRSIDVAEPDFNPIGDAESKGYSYTLHVAPDRPLWDRRYVHHVWTALDADRMNDAAARLVGEHDFAAFAAAGHGRLTTVRTIHECRVVRVGEERLRIEVSGNGFLWNMVRILAGTLAEVGRGKIDPAAIPEIIASGDRRRAGPTLPPTGLCLEWIRYRQGAGAGGGAGGTGQSSRP